MGCASLSETCILSLFKQNGQRLVKVDKVKVNLN